MKAAWLALALAAACAKPAAFDLSIPDTPTDVEARSPADALEAAARDGGPSVRAIAIAAAIDAAGADRSRWLGRGLYDPDPWVQLQALHAAAPHAGDPAVRALFAEHAARAAADPYARAAAAFRLEPAEAPAAREALSAAWRATREPSARGALAFGALALGDDEAEAVIAGALARGDVALELSFLRDVGASGRPALAEALREGTAAAEDELRLAYAAARLALGDRGGRALLVDALADPDPLVRLAVIDAVAELEAGLPVLRAARNAGPEAVRAYAGLVREARRGELGPRLRAAHAAEDAELRILACQWLPRALDAGADAAEARPLARAALGDEDARVRAAAADALGRAGLEAEDLPRLTLLLTDDDVLVRVAAAGALLR